MAQGGVLKETEPQISQRLRGETKAPDRRERAWSNPMRRRLFNNVCKKRWLSRWRKLEAAGRTEETKGGRQRRVSALASQRKERDTERLDRERRSHETTVKHSNLEVFRQNWRKQKDTKLLETRVGELLNSVCKKRQRSFPTRRTG